MPANSERPATEILRQVKLLEREGRNDAAVEFLWTAAELGSAEALFQLGLKHEPRHEMSGAERLCRAAADRGSSQAMFALGLLDKAAGLPDSAKSWWRAASERGNSGAVTKFALTLEEEGDIAEVMLLHMPVAEKFGDTDAMNNLELYYMDSKEADQSITW
jgi:TPR repeat protein